MGKKKQPPPSPAEVNAARIKAIEGRLNAIQKSDEKVSAMLSNDDYSTTMQVGVSPKSGHAEHAFGSSRARVPGA